MTAFSDYLENALLDGTLRNVGIYAGGYATVYLGLHTVEVNDDGSGTEVSGSGYARTAVSFTAPVAGKVESTATVTFPPAVGSWGSITHFGVYDLVSGGNLLYWGSLSTPKPVPAGTTFSFPKGNVTVTLK